MLTTGLILIPLLVSLLAVFAETKRRGKRFPKSIAPAGWVLAILAVTTCCITLYRDAARARADEVREFVALRQIERAVHMLMTPYVAVAAEYPTPEDRFHVAAAYKEAMPALCDVDLGTEQRGRFPSVNQGSMPWGDFITTTVSNGLERLARVQASNEDVLGDEINRLIGTIELHPWNDVVLSAKGWEQNVLRRGDPATASPAQVQQRRRHPLCSPLYRSGYNAVIADYQRQLESIEAHVGRRICTLRRTTGVPDDVPSFLRNSGAYFVPPQFRSPAASEAEDESATACARLRNG